jgi:hypothetical protein
VRLHHLLELLPALALLFAVPSFATSWPDALHSTVPGHLTMVGLNGSVPDSSYPFTVVVRNASGGPVSVVRVTLELIPSDFRICTDQGPGVSVDCGTRTISALTDQNGVVTFHVAGCARNSGGTPESGDRMTVRADGFLLRSGITIAALDQDGCDGMNGNDLMAWLGDFQSGRMFMRSDYDCDGTIGGNDLSIFLAVFFSGTSANGCWNATCP